MDEVIVNLCVCATFRSECGTLFRVRVLRERSPGRATKRVRTNRLELLLRRVKSRNSFTVSLSLRDKLQT